MPCIIGIHYGGKRASYEGLIGLLEEQGINLAHCSFHFMFRKRSAVPLATFTNDGEVPTYRGLFDNFGYKKVFLGIMSDDGDALVRGYYRKGRDEVDPRCFSDLNH